MTKDEKALYKLAEEINILSYDLQKAISQLFSMAGRLERHLHAHLTTKRKPVRGYIPKGKSYL